MPDIENSRKTAEKVLSGSRQNSRKTLAVLPAVFQLFYRDPLGTFFGCFQCRAFGTSVGGHRDCKFRCFSSPLQKRRCGDQPLWSEAKFLDLGFRVRCSALRSQYLYLPWF